jgi:hypothetical protein
MKAIYLLGVFTLSPALVLGQKPVECSAIGQTRIETAPAAFLEVDMPQGAKKLSAYFMVRYLSTSGPWIKCDAGTNCEGRNWPDLAHPGADVDGFEHYAANVPAASSIGDKVAFTAMQDVRLVVTYSMPGPICISQVTFHKKAGSSEARWLYMPQGRPFSTFKTWFRATTQWKLCDDFTGQRNLCVPNGITFDSANQTDSGDQNKGLWFKCRDNDPSGTNTVNVSHEGFCRVQIMYKP